MTVDWPAIWDKALRDDPSLFSPQQKVTAAPEPRREDLTNAWRAWIDQRFTELHDAKLPGLAQAIAPAIADYLKEQLGPLQRELTGLREKLLAPATHVRAFSVLENVKAIEDGGGLRRISGTCSSFKTDRVGDRVSPRGAIIAEHTPLLFQHDPDSAVGWCDEVTPNDESIAFKATIARVQEDGSAGSAQVAALCDRVWTHCRAGTVRGVSIGFAPVPGGSEPIPGGHGVLFSRYHLLEISIVSIPANVDCTLAVIKAMDDPAAQMVIDKMQELQDANSDLWHRIEVTKGMGDLWQNEIAQLRAEIAELRSRTSGMIYRGVFQPDTTYDVGSTVTWHGSLWTAVRQTAARPGDGADACGWQLSCKRGTEGESAYEIAKRLKLPATGSEREWINSLRGDATLPACEGTAEPRPRGTGVAEPRR